MILYIYEAVNAIREGGEALVRLAWDDFSGGQKGPPPAIKRAEGGKPYFEGFPAQFSISHSGSLWCCLMAEFNVGLDIQLQRQAKYEKLAGRFFSQDEAEYVQAHGREGFFEIWARKEAYVKYTGKGFSGAGFSGYSMAERGITGWQLKTFLGGAYIQPVDVNAYGGGGRYAGAICAEKRESLAVKPLFRK